MPEHADRPKGFTRRVLPLIAVAFTLTAWGCGGGVTTDASLNAEEQDRVKKAMENQKAFLTKKRKDKRDGRPASKNL